MTQRVTISFDLHIDLPDGAVVTLSHPRETMVSEQPEDYADAVSSAPAWTQASTQWGDLQQTFVTRATEDLPIRAEVKQSGTRTYVNLFPYSNRYKQRVAHLYPASSRLNVFIAPDRAGDSPLLEPVLSNGKAVSVALYLHSDAAVTEAVNLLRMALDDQETEH